MVSEVSLADRDAVWRHWRAPRGEPQSRPLELWSRALPSSVGNYSPFAKWFLVCYAPWWRLNAWPWAPKLACGLSCPLWMGCGLTHWDITLGVHSSTAPSDGSGIGGIEPQCAPKAQVSSMKKRPQYCFCYTTFSLPACAYGPMGSSLQSVVWQKKSRFKSGLLMVLPSKQAPLESGQQRHYTHFWDIPGDEG